MVLMMAAAKGLSQRERRGCTKLLGCMTDSDLRLLFDTVTSKMVQVTSIRETQEAIVSYTTTAAELLKRRKVHRDVIFKYLANEGVVMPISSDKQQLVERTLELWKSGRVVAYQAPLPPIMKQAPLPPIMKQAPLPPIMKQAPLPEPAIQSTEMLVETSIDALGQRFCQWFFELLNSQNPSAGKIPQDWGPQHFWTDAKLIIMSSAVGHHREEYQGTELVCQRLLGMAKDERLLLSPNLGSHGLRVAASPHGLVLVAVAGTVHRDASCLGIFEQAFGLIRSPVDNTWKIKFTSLQVRGPGHCDGAEGMSPVLTSDFNELQPFATL